MDPAQRLPAQAHEALKEPARIHPPIGEHEHQNPARHHRPHLAQHP
jgi:hypothetical protein